MHEKLFLSADRPFRATPDSRFYFAYESIEAARQTVIRAMMRAEGPVMVLGGAGLGKSLLGLIVADELADRFDVVKLHAARLCSRRALLQSILFELHLPYRDLSEGDLRLSILSRMEPSSQHAPDGILIVVDEADTLPAKLLDELRLITNFTRANQPRARLVLIGNMRLEHTFAEPQMESFNQRLAARCYLQPMNRQQTRDYVLHQLTVAGFKPKELITEDAINSVYAASEGVPRLTNQIMDHALALAVTGSQCPVSSALIEEAWADLQQLPAPWHAGAERISNAVDRSTANSGVASSSVEFGTLDEEDDWGSSSELPVMPLPSPGAAKQNLQAVYFGTYPSASKCEDSDEDLRLADEPVETNLTSRKNNFFAAFIPPENGSDIQFEQSVSVPHNPSYAESFEDDSTELDLASEGIGLSSNGTSNPNPETSPIDVDPNKKQRGIVTMASDSFFYNRPTDELLLALDDEQRGYDAMGVWENDPPISARSNAVELPAKSKTNGTQVASQLFGEDFEEEEYLSVAGANQGAGALAKPTLSILPRDDINSAKDNSAHQASEVADYVEQIEQFAHSMAAANRPESGSTVPTVDEVLAESRLSRDDRTFAPTVDSATLLNTWSMDVAAIDVSREVAVHNEIEDLVSQLNFSAFSVEPFSVEQIVIEPRDRQPNRPDDFWRSGKNDEIYTMHSPRGVNDKADELAALHSHAADDDRDLLVIEEELPQTLKSDDLSRRPVTKIAPYSQLFAKLRK